MSEIAKRATLVRLSMRGRDWLEKNLPAGYNAVVIVTDLDGAFVGVSASCGDDYCELMLRAALDGAELKRHKA